MKKVTFILFVGFSLFASSQNNITYKILEDNPDANPNSFVNIEWFGIDGSMDANTGLFLGIDGNYQLTSKIGAEGNLRLKYLNFEKTDKKPLFNVELGANYLLFKKHKVKNLNIILFKSSSRSGSTETVHTTSFQAPGHIENSLYGRGGISFRRNSLPSFQTFSSMAIYVGINFQQNIRFNTKVTYDDSDYERGKAWLANIYGDFLFSPIINSPLPNSTDSSRIGYRFGMQWYNTLPQSFFAKMVVFAEISKRPIEKTVLTLGVGFPLYQK